MKLYKFPLLACIITILAISCEKGPNTDSNGNSDKPVTESGEGYSVTYKYKDGVIVFDETSSHYVKEIISDTIVVFSTSIPDDLTPRAGDVVSSRVYPEIPYGLGNKVLSIQKEGDGYRCVTTPAALEDIFSDLIINSEFALPLEDEDTKVSFSPILNLDLNKEYKDHVKISGGVDLGVLFICNVDLKARKFEISLKFSTELDCGVSVYAGLPDELKKWYPFPNKTIFRNVVEIGPVVLHPYLDFRPYLSFDLEGSVDIIEFQKKSSWTVGIKDGKAFQEKATDNADISNIIKNLTIDAKGEIALNLPFKFGLGVYTKGIAVELQPTAAYAFGADCQLINPNLFIEGPELTFEARIDTYAAAFVRILGKEFFCEQGQLASLSLFKKEWPLLPRLVDETLIVRELGEENTIEDELEGKDSVDFVASYTLKPGLLSKFLDIRPGFTVYEAGNVISRTIDENPIRNEELNCTYKFANLKSETPYYGRTCIKLGNNIYEGAGVEFKKVDTRPIRWIESTENWKAYFYYDDIGQLSKVCYKEEGYSVTRTFSYGDNVIHERRTCSDDDYSPTSDYIFEAGHLKTVKSYDGTSTSFVYSEDYPIFASTPNTTHWSWNNGNLTTFRISAEEVLEVNYSYYNQRNLMNIEFYDIWEERFDLCVFLDSKYFNTFFSRDLLKSSSEGHNYEYELDSYGFPEKMTIETAESKTTVTIHYEPFSDNEINR